MAQRQRDAEERRQRTAREPLLAREVDEAVEDERR